jgi:hypothetical protein
MLLLMLLVLLAAIAFGRWRGFGTVQWIWMLAGLSFAMLLLWAILLVFVIGPGMQEMGPPGR